MTWTRNGGKRVRRWKRKLCCANSFVTASTVMTVYNKTRYTVVTARETVVPTVVQSFITQLHFPHTLPRDVDLIHQPRRRHRVASGCEVHA